MRLAVPAASKARVRTSAVAASCHAACIKVLIGRVVVVLALYVFVLLHLLLHLLRLANRVKVDLQLSFQVLDLLEKLMVDLLFEFSFVLLVNTEVTGIPVRTVEVLVISPQWSRIAALVDQLLTRDDRLLQLVALYTKFPNLLIVLLLSRSLFLLLLR